LTKENEATLSEGGPIDAETPSNLDSASQFPATYSPQAYACGTPTLAHYCLPLMQRASTLVGFPGLAAFRPTHGFGKPLL